jgi:hypothetical protein
MIKVTIGNTLFECSTTDEAATLFKSLSRRNETADGVVRETREVKARKTWSAPKTARPNRNGMQMNRWTNEEVKKVYDMIRAGITTPGPVCKDRGLLSRHSAKAISILYYKLKNNKMTGVSKEMLEYVNGLSSSDHVTQPVSRRSLLDPIDTPYKIG